MNIQLKTILDRATALLGNSLQELNLYLRSSNSSDSVEESEKILELVQTLTTCEREIREYLNKVGGRNGSKRVKNLIDSLSDSLGDFNRLENPSISGKIERIQGDLDTSCEPPDDC